MKRWLRLLGTLLALGAAWFFIQQAAVTWNSVDFGRLLSWQTALGVAAMLVLYLAQIPIAATAWRLILRDLRIDIPWRSSYAVIAMTQFGKYLPGNVAQHIGRVAVARRYGADLPRLTLSLVYENLIALLVGAHITAVMLLWNPAPELEQWLPSAYRRPLVAAVTAAAIAGFLILPRLVDWIQSRRMAAPAAAYHLSIRNGLACYALFVVAFMTLGLGFTLLADAVSSTGRVPFVVLGGAFAAAWIIGLLVPGAPAGLGVREGVLLVLVSPVMAQADGIAAIALLRLVTTLGDLLQFLYGSWRMRREAAAV